MSSPGGCLACGPQSVIDYRPGPGPRSTRFTGAEMPDSNGGPVTVLSPHYPLASALIAGLGALGWTACGDATGGLDAPVVVVADDRGRLRLPGRLHRTAGFAAADTGRRADLSGRTGRRPAARGQRGGQRRPPLSRGPLPRRCHPADRAAAARGPRPAARQAGPAQGLNRTGSGASPTGRRLSSPTWPRVWRRRTSHADGRSRWPQCGRRSPRSCANLRCPRRPLRWP